MKSKIIYPKAGKYILAVSGGVDSVVLLDVLAKESKKRKYEILVAHFNHGIREDSAKDETFVKNLADTYGLEFASAKGHLGKDTSEAKARDARYKFLRQICKKSNADAIITAHHLDDRIETALFNLRRGTGRRGLVPFRDDNDILRPLKNIYKSEILDYAREQKLKWHEDPSNKSEKYSRNVLRNKIIPEIESSEPGFKLEFAKLLDELESDNKRIDVLLEKRLQNIGKVQTKKILLERTELIKMRLDVLTEFLYFCLLKLDAGAELLSPQLKRLAHFCKTAKAGTRCTISGGLQALATRDTITVVKDGQQR